jgi:putative NIF3 family GTP cyclohydrolase 1 type 2
LEAGMRAREIVELIRQNLGVPWREGFRDTFKIGDPETEVRGVATTVMATFDQIKRAHAAGANLIITHEPTFWSDSDSIKELDADPVFQAKQKYCLDNRIVVWRFHDNWHARNKPDMEAYATARKLGLASADPATYTNQQQVFDIPPTTLGAYAEQVKRLMGVKTLRVAGDPKAKVSRVICGVGSGTPALSPVIDVAVGGEGIETDGGFDSTEYARDASALGIGKGFIILGHAISEEPGMQECAVWLRTLVGATPVTFVPAGEPFWS